MLTCCTAENMKDCTLFVLKNYTVDHFQETYQNEEDIVMPFVYLPFELNVFIFKGAICKMLNRQLIVR